MQFGLHGQVPVLSLAGVLCLPICRIQERKSVPRHKLLAVASGALVLSFPLTAGPAAASPAAPTTAVSWAPCDSDPVEECATIQVPVDWSDAHSKTLDLAVGRLRALDTAHRRGVLFANPGGPGASGIDVYITGRGIPDTSDLRKYFDIVSWDPRGAAGRSSPVECDADLVAAATTTFPESEQEYQKIVDANAALGADCRSHAGSLFDHIDTVSTVRDMDEIRAALGEEKIEYFGVSYGTQLGQQYAEMFPSRVKAMVLDSNLDHSITSGGTYIVDETRDLEGAFLQFANWCAATATCRLNQVNVVALWDGLLAKANAGTLVDPATGVPESGEALRNELNNSMNRPERSWFPFAQRLAVLAGLDHPAAAARSTANLTDDSYQSIWCEDWRWQVSGFAELTSYRSAARRVAPHTQLSPFWSDITTCLGWPAPVKNPQHTLSIQGAPPILVAASRYDPNTSNSWSAAVARQIPNSVLLQYDGVGHGTYNRSPCAREYIEAYLTTLKTPAAGTHCPAVWPTQPPAAAAQPVPDLPSTGHIG
jgi:pimeloyl-ACP methyl ester carboxylesterase